MPDGEEDAGCGLVTVTDDARHNLETGDYVRFDEVVGMEALNDAAPQPIKVFKAKARCQTLVDTSVSFFMQFPSFLSILKINNFK